MELCSRHFRHWRPTKPNHGLSLVPSRSALWLNAHGQRIAPAMVSEQDARDLVTQLCVQPQGYGWQVLNRTITRRELAISGSEFNPSIRNRSKLGVLRDLLLGNSSLVNEVIQHSPDVVTTRTLADLAARMNALQQKINEEYGYASARTIEVDADTLTQTVRQYDAEVAKCCASQDVQRQMIARLRQYRGDALRICKTAKIEDGSDLIAIRTEVISRKSLGGIQTDLHSRVLRRDGSAIDGLFAVGEAAGLGGSGMNGMCGLEGTFLGGCIYSARRAAVYLNEAQTTL